MEPEYYSLAYQKHLATGHGPYVQPSLSITLTPVVILSYYIRLGLQYLSLPFRFPVQNCVATFHP
jgi:hypothetical protein